MDDFRTEFYANYETAIESGHLTNDSHYLHCARQYQARWKKWLPSDRSSRMLDLGCGGGEYLYYLYSEGYSAVQGIDVSANQVARAQQRGVVNVECGDVIQYVEKLQDNTFDAISAFNFFEHLTKPEVLPLLREIHRVLRPDGRLLVVTPNGVSPFSGTNRYADFSHNLSYTPNTWRQLARIVGFRQSYFGDHGPIPYSLAGIVRTVLWKGVTLVLDGLSYIEIGSPRDASHVYTADMMVVLIKA